MLDEASLNTVIDQFVKMNKNTNDQEEQQASACQSSGVKIVSRTGKELVVEVYGGASHCLDGVGEDEPAVLLDWNPNQVRAAVALANRDRPALPAWMPDSYPITEERLTQALIQRIGAFGSGIIVGRILIAQNSIDQYTRINQAVALMMGSDKFLLHICGPAECQPLAKIYVFADEKRKKTAVTSPFPRVPIGFAGVQLFDFSS